MRVLLCSLCGHPAVNQYGHSPFDQLATLDRHPSIVLHLSCADSLARELSEMTGVSESGVGIKDLRGHYHAR